MITVNSQPKVILIGGALHAGKSTLAKTLALKLGWRYVSTDSLARHPGRPWKPKPNRVPDHVAEHYLVHHGVSNWIVRSNRFSGAVERNG